MTHAFMNDLLRNINKLRPNICLLVGAGGGGSGGVNGTGRRTSEKPPSETEGLTETDHASQCIQKYAKGGTTLHCEAVLVRIGGVCF